MKMNLKKNSNRRQGFSLVEVTIAMGIAALASVTLLGMIPEGQESMRDAGDRAIMGRIHQGILSEIQLTPFGKGTGTELIDSFNGKERYYDNQGELLVVNASIPDRSSVGQIRESLEHVYSAKIHIPKPAGGSVPKSVGGAGYSGIKLGGTDVNPNVRTVIIEVAMVSGRDSQSSPFDWEKEKNFSTIKTYQTMVVKTGQDFTKKP